MTLKRAFVILTFVLAVSMFSLAQTDDVRITSGPTVNASDHSAEISWQTNNQAATLLRYGKDSNRLDKESRHSGGARDHRVTLAELEPGTTYHFAILTSDGKERTRGQFTTKGTSQAATSGTSTQSGAVDDDVRIVEGPFLKELTTDTAVLFWRTNNVAASDVKYGTDPNNLDKRAYEPGGSRDHDLRLTDLERGRTYYFQILTRKGAIRTAGQFTTEGVSTVTTAQTGQTTQQQAQNETIWQRVRRIGEQNQQGQMSITQGPVVEIVTDNAATIVWTTNGRANSVVRYGDNSNSLNQTAQGGWGDQHRVTLTGLRANTTYYFRVESAASEGTGSQALSTVTAFRTVNQGEQARRTAFPR